MISCLCPPSLSREHRRTAPPDNIRNAPSVAPTESEKHMRHPALGNYSMPITHMLPSTQRLFDEGLMLAFNFNQHEAQIWFNLSVATESDCAMCWWGLPIRTVHISTSRTVFTQTILYLALPRQGTLQILQPRRPS